MTMETQKNSYSDLYLMLSPIYDTLHLRRCNLGDKGFEEFALENVLRAHDQALFPNNWMFHYHFSEEQIPRIKSLDGMHRRDFFQKLRPALLEEGITPLHILPLDRALYLHIHCKPLLASCRDIPTLALSDLFARDGNPDFELNLARPPFRAYTAVKTCQGVLLFTPTPKGARLLEGFMQNIADNFFLPQMPETEITISKLPAFDSELQDFADLCPLYKPSLTQRQKEMILAPAIFESEKILGNGLEYFHLDMAPTWSNYHKLVFPNNRTGLSCTQRNFNIMRLLAIAETGHFIYKFQNGMPETFSYRSSFSDLVKDRTPQYTELVSRRAKELLDRDFPDLRGRLAEQNQMQQQAQDKPDRLYESRSKGLKF